LPWDPVSAKQQLNGLETHLKPLLTKGIILELDLAEQALADGIWRGKDVIGGKYRKMDQNS
jgi:hypothetical protein